MPLKKLVKEWFDKWENGDFENIPITDNFVHISPFGKIEGKENYVNLIRANKEAFLGGKFIIHDAIYEDNHACVRYTVQSGNSGLEVSEWFYLSGVELLGRIISYYNVGNVSYEKNFTMPK